MENAAPENIVFRGVVQWRDQERVLASRGLTIFESTDEGAGWREVVRLPGTLPMRLKASSRLSRRLLRAGVHHIQKVTDGIVVIVASGHVFRCDLRSGEVVRSSTPILGSRPLALCFSGGMLYYGQYSSNTEREGMAIMASDDHGLTWYPARHLHGIRHIHGVYADPFNQNIWVTTGDSDQESAIWLTSDHFASIEKVTGGSQQQRAIKLLFTDESIVFGSDSPEEINHIYTLCRRSGALASRATIDGSAFHGCRVGDKLFISSACEPSAVNLGGHASIWMSADQGTSWDRIVGFRKDGLPMKLFQYGQIMFPAGDNPGPYLWYTPFATQRDQCSYRLRLHQDV